ncbi:MAG TPA: ExeM/NucH family extracellular endonuclease [Crinalium sp.]|jgi:predicted extracellular nuclease
MAATTDPTLSASPLTQSVTPDLLTTLAAAPTPGITITQTEGSTDVNEEGETADTYTIALNTVPIGTVVIQVAADVQQLKISTDGVNYFSTALVRLSSTTPVTITVRPIDDTRIEDSPHVAVIRHLISTSTDPAYSRTLTPIPDVNVNIIDNDSAVVKISTIQGRGTTATAGTFTIEGIVTASFQGQNQLNGFYLQEEDADADTGAGSELTSEAIFVNSGVPVKVGDKVRIRGVVSEKPDLPDFGQARITPISNAAVSILASGQSRLVAPTAIDLPAASATSLERYEGMLVTVKDRLTVTDTSQLGRSGEITLSSEGILTAPTDTIDPNNSPASETNSSGNSNVGAVTAQQTANTLSTIVLDNGSNNSFLFPTPYINRASGEPATLRLGSTIDNLTGILSYGSGAYRVLRNPYSVSDPLNQAYPLTINYSDRPAVPNVGGGLKVSSFNVSGYFTTLDNGANNAAGANSAAELQRQRDKIVAALLALNADVVGLVEIENGTAAVSDLVDALNARAGAGTYTLIADPTGYAALPGGGAATKVALIYKSGVVTPVGGAIAPNDAAFSSGRAPIAQPFRVNATGELFTPVINQFTSRDTNAGLPRDSNQGDGQGLSNATRKAQATALLNFVNTTVIPQAGDEDVILLGDFNAYTEEDPIDILRAGEFTRLNTAPTYVSGGQAGSLDHILVSSSLVGQTTGAATWNINAYEPSALDYNDNVVDAGESSTNPPRNEPGLYQANPFRSSDHDPVLAGLNLNADASVGWASFARSNDGVLVNIRGRFAFDALDQTTANLGAGNGYVNDFWQELRLTGDIDLSVNDGFAPFYNATFNGAPPYSYTNAPPVGSATPARPLTGISKLIGSPYNDYIQTGSNDDILLGGDGDDFISADGAAEDVGNDILVGGSGNDFLTGGGDRGSVTLNPADPTSGSTLPSVATLTVGDVIQTGDGNDKLIFWRGNGTDLVTDFAAGSDKILIHGYTSNDLILLGTTAVLKNGSAYEAITSSGQASYTTITGTVTSLTGNGYIWQASDFTFL